MSDDVKVQHFGEHFTLDGYGGDPVLLNNLELLMQILAELPGKLGMRILMAPQGTTTPGNGAKDPGGCSGFVVIEESHISIHTFPARGFVTADVYSCKNGMDLEFIKNYFTEKYSLQDLETNFIIRGTRYPSENLQ